MNKQERINEIKELMTAPNTAEKYYELLENMGDLKTDYHTYATTEPINCDKELERVPNADYELCTALLTMILREDHFSNGSFERRQRLGHVNAILKRMLENLSTNGSVIMTNGIFGDVFDINNDGNLDSFEQGLDFMFLDELTKDGSDDSDNDDF